MGTYTVTLSDAEEKALAYVALDPQAWIDNAVKNRCRIAMEQIVHQEVDRKIAAGELISGTREDIVLAAPIKSALEQEAELQAETSVIGIAAL